VVWYAATGAPMQDGDWHDAGRRTLGLRIAIGTGGTGPTPGHAVPHGATTLMFLLNAAPDTVEFTLPADAPRGWSPLFDSARDDIVAAPVTGGRYQLAACSLALLAPRPPIAR